MSQKDRSAWNKVFSSHRPRILQPDDLEAVYHSPILRFFLDGFRSSSGLRILEAGCGSGKFSASLANAGHKVVALDFAAESLRIVYEYRTRSENGGRDIRLQILQGDIQSLCIKDQSFDVVFNEGVVEHSLRARERIKSISEMKRVTRPGGVVGVAVPNGRHPFMKIWKMFGYPGYFDELVPAWYFYGASRLKHEMEAAGLIQVEVDGLDPYKSLNLWPRNRLFEVFAIACDKMLPRPKWLRQRWGIHLIAKGRRIN
ncbi:MAG: class I SAM-dependent methyltransferase [Desulfobacterales bacterium]|nr:MAG: class I SAM-dependent methyltransferase [Desulfobacterales bacterium]